MEFWNKILLNLKQQKSIVLMVVVENKGSSPGKQGFKMAVVSDGNKFGSIGGGVTEHRMIERAKEMLAEKINVAEMHMQVHRDEEEQKKSGMICSGENTVILYPLQKEHIDNINEIAGNAIIGEETTIKISLTQFMSRSGANIPKQYEFSKDGVYKEVVGYRHTVFIVGGGHVGLALSRQMKILGFYVKIYDNRKDLDTFIQNIYADEKEITDYNHIEKYLPQRNDVYAVISSFSHQNDKNVLKKLLNKDLKYLGMMGSKNKVEEIFKQLKDEGIEEELLRKVHAPIGVAIKSETPEEIAVSIAAEIIHIKNTSK